MFSSAAGLPSPNAKSYENDNFDPSAEFPLVCCPSSVPRSSVENSGKSANDIESRAIYRGPSQRLLILLILVLNAAASEDGYLLSPQVDSGSPSEFLFYRRYENSITA
jgi:hypothetical protein